MKESRHTILTITGSDGTGGSGVQADIRTITALGGHAVSAITSVTMQNTLGIQEFFDLPADTVARQIEAIVDDMMPQAVKIGMLRSVEVVKAVAALLRKRRPEYVVYDPVVYTSRGERLMTDDVVAAIRTELLPLCDVVVEFRDGKASHGAGGALASAIAVYLCKGYSREEAMQQAEHYVSRQLVSMNEVQGRSSELYHEFLRELAAHHATNSDVHFYADRLNVSSRYLAQVTKRIAGQSPKAIIDEYLLSEIKIALGTTRKTIQEVAYQFGFSSQAHFANFFRKMTGEPPSAFRAASRTKAEQ